MGRYLQQSILWKKYIMCMLMNSSEPLTSQYGVTVSLELSHNVNSVSLDARCMVTFYFFAVLFCVL